jgi:hypothetical protein
MSKLSKGGRNKASRWVERMVYEPVAYEERLIAFYDVLGWRQKIKEAGDDPIELQKLRINVDRFSWASRSLRNWNYRSSTFSDNVVVSTRFDHKPNQNPSDLVWNFLAFLGEQQLSSAAMGTLIRGALTLGKLVHKEGIVFGPGLIRAYELESTTAIYPRVVLDVDVVTRLGELPPFVVTEDNVSFIDPFNPPFVNLLRGYYRNSLEKRTPAGSRYGDVLESYIPSVVRALRKELSKPVAQKEWSKLSWLYNRISINFGLRDSAADYRRTVLHAP